MKLWPRLRPFNRYLGFLDSVTHRSIINPRECLRRLSKGLRVSPYLLYESHARRCTIMDWLALRHLLGPFVIGPAPT
jgi:hypothetical protein